MGAGHLYGASSGRFGKLVDIIDKAALTAKGSNETRITREILERAILTIKGDQRRKKKDGIRKFIDIATKPGGKPGRIKDHRDVATMQQAHLNKRA